MIHYEAEGRNGAVIELNEHGLAIWQCKSNPYLFADRAYRWVDRILITDESCGNRTVSDASCKFSTFDFTDWEPMTKEIHDKGVEDKKPLLHQFYGPHQRGHLLSKDLGL